MKTIKCLSKVEFNQYIEKYGIESNHAYIQILDDGQPLIPVSDNAIHFYFDDVEDEPIQFESTLLRPTRLFSEDQAIEIIQFLENNLGKDTLIVHCTMGKCRSGAVGDFASDFYGLDYSTFKRNNPRVQPNTHVKKTLNDVFKWDEFYGYGIPGKHHSSVIFNDDIDL